MPWRTFASYQYDQPLDLDLGGRVERLNGVHVTTNMFDVLGAALVAGRGFVTGDADTGAAPVAILSERVWRTLFGADRAIIGDVIRIGGLGETRPVTVIGGGRASGRFVSRSARRRESSSHRR